ncbi:hypothetical protein UA08_06779 [Talaromyces atroroseus]|uniref:MADS-box domain-containing protein n=1 Tax=Talaromyces atroroseus TaxID=1441469 RepID=A0A225AU81_TALAT|nr:hypothetical protein UA08_06779 [Talaromyces atroroseus]OKL57975.1 hypothetical protein UA08_06779 [Talaromyces atroroseus]
MSSPSPSPSPGPDVREPTNKRSKAQQKLRRRKGLFKKAKEFITKCDSDVYLIVRNRKTGQIHYLNSDSSGEWPPAHQSLRKYEAGKHQTLDSCKG